MIEIKGYNRPAEDEKFVFLTLENLLEEALNLDIEAISLSPYSIFGDKKKFIYTDSEHPLVYMDCFLQNNKLGIDEEYFLEHKEVLLDIIIRIIKGKTGSIRITDEELLIPEVIDAIISNTNIKSVSLGAKSNPFVLTEELYRKFKEAGKEEVYTYAVADELKENFDSIIGYNASRHLLNYNTYNSLHTMSLFFLNNDVIDEELDNFKYLNPDAKVRIKFNNIKNPIRLVNAIYKYHPHMEITIDIEDKNKFNAYLFKNFNDIPNDCNLKIDCFGETVEYKDYLNYEKRLTEMVLPAVNLSPFEKYLYVYDLVSKYKKYKENEDNKQSSRNLYQLLDNEYMVCVGYSKLLIDLLGKLGIKATDLGVTVDVGLDYIPDDTKVLPDFIVKPNGDIAEVKTVEGGHARVFVSLVDPKYGIDGYYVADPTWDNVMEKKAFNHALMTGDEVVGLNRYNYFNTYGISELFYVHSLEEFYDKLNILLDKNRKKNEVDYIRDFVSYFEKIDVEMYKFLIEKYPKIDKYGYNPDKETIQNILLDIGEHVVSKTNNVVVGTQFREAITELYKSVYMKEASQEEIDAIVQEIMDYNSKRQERCFPTKYKIDGNGMEMVILNAVNKFEIDNRKELSN